MRVVLQPCSNPTSREHFESTVRKPVSVEQIKEFLSKDVLAEMRLLFPEGYASLWGVAPGGGKINPRTFESLSVGDVVLFSDTGFFVSAGVVAVKFENERVARHLWGEDKDGDTWQYVYAITNLTTINIPCEEVSLAIGYLPLFIYRTFRVLSESRSASFFQSFPNVVNSLGVEVSETTMGDGRDSPKGRGSLQAAHVEAKIRGLTSREVNNVIDEWKQIGRDEFFARYKVNKAVRYVIREEDASFDAKAILVAALRKFRPELGEFKASVFNGNAQSVAVPLRALGFDVVDIIDDQGDLEDDEHEKRLRNRSIKGPVETVQLVRARRGQGAFRDNVLSREPKCRITGISDPLYLRASHIKPWRKCDDLEKIDGNNGLMLAPHVDFLFDRGLISFQDNGEMLVSSDVPEEILAVWAISSSLNVGQFSAEQKAYLLFHRENEFRQ